MAKSISSFLPIYEIHEKRLQADIGITLYNKANKIRRARKLTWTEILTGLLSKFVEDLSVKEDPRMVK